MSFRRNNSRRQAGPGVRRRESVTSTGSHEGSVENPNAYGLFGHYEAPAAVHVQDHDEDLQHQQGRAHEHHHSGYATQHPGWHTVEVHHGAGFGGPEERAPHRHQHQSSEQYNYAGPTESEGHSPLVTSNAYIQPTESQAQLGLHPPLSPDLSRKGSRRDPGASDFDLVHSAKGGHLESYGAELPIRVGHLFKRPLIRQWVLQDKLYREIDDREPSQFELFFDLVMVGIIHKLADSAAEGATGLNVAKFILVFYPAWSIWTDVRGYINVSGTDDVFQRIYILIVMILLVGYAANATGIIIEKAEGETAGEGATAGHGEGATSADGGFEKRAFVTLAGMVGTYLVKRGGGGESDSVPPVLVQEIGHTSYWFASGWHGAIASAMGFYLVAKFLRLGLFFIYGLMLPKFRKALWLNMISLIIISCVYLPIIFITRPGLIVILVVAGIILELSSRFIVAAAMQILHGRAKHKGHKTYMPAYSLPHLMERMTQFTILVVGESIMNATFVAFSGEFGPQNMFWRASLAIVIPFLIIWLYFDNDSSRTFVHGLKRHWFTSITFTHLHFPLCASLILMSSALVKLIKEEAVETGYLWFFSASIATAILCIGLLGTMHKSLDVWGSSAIPKSARISLRFVLAAVFAVMPLLYHWKSVEFLGAHAALLAFAVAFETFGKLGSYGRRYDPVRAEELRKQRKEASGQLNPDDSIPLSTIKDPSGSNSPVREKRHTRRLSASANEMLELATRKLHKDGKVKGPGRRASWHEYDDLTGAERGEEDVGIESELGKIECKEVSSGERWAYVAT